MDFRRESLRGLADRVRSKELAAREVVQAALARVETLDAALHAFTQVEPELALAEAGAIDERIARGEDPGPLAGIPIGVKDLEAARGFTTSYGSPLHVDDAPSELDSPLVARLRDHGAVVIGKTNTPEHGHKGDTHHPELGATGNPWSLERSPGGSSGGTSAAVAAGIIPLGTASDGGGSIRIPAALCGLPGFKASQGRVPVGGPKPPGSGLFTVKGPLANTVRDTVYALDACVGPDPTDPFALPAPHTRWTYALDDVAPPAKVLWAPTMGYEVDDEILAVCEAAVRVLEGLGTEVIPVGTVFADDPVMPWLTLWSAYRERAQGHLRGTPGWERIDPTLRAQMDYCHDYLTAVDVAKAMDAIHLHNYELVQLFSQAPLLLCPTVAGQTALSGGQGTINGEESLTWVRFTYPFNLTRHPAGSVNAGFTADGMPVGLQIVGPQHADIAVLRAMAALEDALAIDRLAPFG